MLLGNLAQFYATLPLYWLPILQSLVNYFVLNETFSLEGTDSPEVTHLIKDSQILLFLSHPSIYIFFQCK